MPVWINFKELRSKLDFEKVLQHYGVKITRKGNQHHGFCPLPKHDGNKKSASFSANLERGIFQCFACKAKGNVIDFAAYMQKLDPENGEHIRKVALELQERFCPSNSQPEKEKPTAPAPVEVKRGEANTEPHSLTVVNARLDFELKGLDPKHPYLSGRGFSSETIHHFGLGYCSRGFLAGRIAIPLHNQSSELIGYAGRLVDDARISEENPKYLFPSKRERSGVIQDFDESRLVYNGHRIAEPVDQLIVVRGFASVWWLWQTGYSNVVGLMSCACSDEQANILATLTKSTGHVWLMSTEDGAGDRLSMSVLSKIAAHRSCRWAKLESGVRPMHCTKEKLNSFFNAETTKPATKAEQSSIKMRLMIKQITVRQAIIELAESLPCLETLSLSKATWDPEMLDNQAGKLSTGERGCVQFLLHVWNPHRSWHAGAFDIGVLDSWDKRHRQAFARWASDPWWC